MKRIIPIIISVMVIMLSSCANMMCNNDVIISYNALSLDSSYKQFKKACKANQIEILRYLLDCAEEEFDEQSNLKELLSVKENMRIIKFYNSKAKQNSIYITNVIRELSTDILEEEAKYRGVSSVDGELPQYVDKGQDE